MPLTLSEGALDWALRHAETLGDTDIFPELFEFLAIRHEWNKIRPAIQSRDASDWGVRPYRRCLTPKHRHGFRVSTQLDPLDFLVFSAVVHEAGSRLETARVAKNLNIVHSYRFEPSFDGRMYSENFTYRTFQKSSHAAIASRQITHVVVADIADFFPRLYTHRIDNAIDTALGVGHLHAQSIKNLISHWAGTYSYGLPVGTAASRLIAEVTINDIDQTLLSERCRYVRYSDDFRLFAKSESDAYRHLTILARSLIENHGLTLQQHKTRILPVDTFRSVYLKENEQHEVDTLSEKFYELLDSIGISDTYSDIDIDSLDDDARIAIDQLNLQGILKEQIENDDPDLSLIKFILRRLGQLKDADSIDLILGNFDTFVPVIREAIEYLLRLDELDSKKKRQIGKKLLRIFQNRKSTAPHLEYSRMYLVHPFSMDASWSPEAEHAQLHSDAIDDFTRRELLLAMGRRKMDFWFRSRKQYLGQLQPWLRTAYIYGASCMPADEYRHWIRGIQTQLNEVERAVAAWARANPIA